MRDRPEIRSFWGEAGGGQEKGLSENRMDSWKEAVTPAREEGHAGAGSSGRAEPPWPVAGGFLGKPSSAGPNLGMRTLQLWMNPLHWGHGAPCTPQPHPCHPPDAGLVVQAVRNKGKLRLSKPQLLLERGECKEGCMHLTRQVRLWGSDTVRIQGLALAEVVPGGMGSKQWWRTPPPGECHGT